MSWDTYLRLMIQGDKEAVVTSVEVTATPAQFTTQLTTGQTRKVVSVYNNSNSASGEIYYGYSASISAGSNSQPIPKGAKVDIPVADVSAIDLYLVAETGETGDARVEEIA